MQMSNGSEQQDINALGYAPESHELATQILDAIQNWQARTGGAFTPTETNWRIAEALHLVTWHRPHTHAPLTLLQDEERQAANAA
jgi:hypothetical protein